MLQEVEAGSTVHLPLDQLEAADLNFSRPKIVTPIPLTPATAPRSAASAAMLSTLSTYRWP